MASGMATPTTATSSSPARPRRSAAARRRTGTPTAPPASRSPKNSATPANPSRPTTLADSDEFVEAARQALALDSRQVASPRNHARLKTARDELVGAISAIRDHYSLSDAEVVMLLAQGLQEYANRVGCADIARQSGKP
jgi:hypothetical protein